ncbi:hypothetical protein AJ80_07209 [Polytolypa hystricis UAMH7299]|uniref:Uncharacterized protein n=1 Tax=Polytolypa hystricis (strain UAMH7299) TaxID=1447883 RepID=A0A2B7XHJ4_POLH7|nr:hypothetical protein AJ80_07209 [Polytolypa hystricis UAMH7299]
MAPTRSQSSSIHSPTPSKSTKSSLTTNNNNMNINTGTSANQKLFVSATTFSQDISRAMQASSKLPKFASYTGGENSEHPPPPPPSPVGFGASCPWGSR